MLGPRPLPIDKINGLEYLRVEGGGQGIYVHLAARGPVGASRPACEPWNIDLTDGADAYESGAIADRQWAAKALCGRPWYSFVTTEAEKYYARMDRLRRPLGLDEPDRDPLCPYCAQASARHRSV